MSDEDSDLTSQLSELRSEIFVEESGRSNRSKRGSFRFLT